MQTSIVAIKRSNNDDEEQLVSGTTHTTPIHPSPMKRKENNDLSPSRLVRIGIQLVYLDRTISLLISLIPAGDYVDPSTLPDITNACSREDFNRAVAGSSSMSSINSPSSQSNDRLTPNDNLNRGLTSSSVGSSSNPPSAHSNTHLSPNLSPSAELTSPNRRTRKERPPQISLPASSSMGSIGIAHGSPTMYHSNKENTPTGSSSRREIGQANGKESFGLSLRQRGGVSSRDEVREGNGS